MSEKATWHMCSDLPDPSHSTTKIARCGECGLFWRREYHNGNRTYWAPVTGKEARHLRRQMRARGVR